MHDVFFNVLNAGLTFPLGYECMTLC